jgi:aspartyl-tRNA(Asn)/glutamyl-tRNA(Gln) amidotransferase subunit B
MKYVPTIGLEIHVQLATKTKMFCRCDNDATDKDPNTTVCPLCMGLPGTLPVVNAKAIEWGAQLALSLGCQINKFQRFDRKNYFYPDLPKGYQISQFFYPVGENGNVKVDYLGEDRKTKQEFNIGITRLHLEEDAGKLIHSQKHTLVDFNRCGTPLAEIVTEPDIKSPAEARAFLQELQRIVRQLGVSYADMEKGQLRVDANISVRPEGQKELGTKVEVKNMNSFKFIEQALNYEVERQINILEESGKIDQETRGWDAKTGTTISQRGKEGSIDYRYFPEPDLPPIVLSEEQIEKWDKEIGLLPVEIRDKAEELGLPYNRVCELQDKGELIQFVEKMEISKDLDPNVVANWPGMEIDFYNWVNQEKPSNNMVKQVFKNMQKGDSLKTALEKIDETEDEEVEKIIDAVLKDNADVVEKYKNGEEKVLGFLIGQVMQQGRGKVDPGIAKDKLLEILTK